MKRFAVCYVTLRRQGPIQECGFGLLFVNAEDETGARCMAMRAVLRHFPVEQGWRDHMTQAKDAQSEADDPDTCEIDLR